MILQHDQRYPDIDADDILAIPPLIDVEGVTETISAPDTITISIVHGSQGSYRQIGGENNRASRRRRRYCPIMVNCARWGAISGIPIWPIRGGESPDMLIIRFEIALLVNSKLSICESCINRT